MKNRHVLRTTMLAVLATMFAGAAAVPANAATYPMCTSSDWGGNFYCDYTNSSVSRGMTGGAYFHANGSGGYQVFVVAPSNGQTQVWTRWQDYGGPKNNGWVNMGGNLKLPPTPSYVRVSTISYKHYIDLQLKVKGTDGNWWCRVRHQPTDSWDTSWAKGNCVV